MKVDRMQALHNIYKDYIFQANQSAKHAVIASDYLTDCDFSSSAA